MQKSWPSTDFTLPDLTSYLNQQVARAISVLWHSGHKTSLMSVINDAKNFKILKKQARQWTALPQRHLALNPTACDNINDLFLEPRWERLEKILSRFCVHPLCTQVKSYSCHTELRIISYFIFIHWQACVWNCVCLALHVIILSLRELSTIIRRPQKLCCVTTACDISNIRLVDNNLLETCWPDSSSASV